MARGNPTASRGDVIKVSGTNAGQRARWRQVSGRSLSAWMRQAADRAADGFSSVLTSGQYSRLEETLLTLRADLNRGAGNNLNQIAQALNTDLRSGLGADGRPMARPSLRSRQPSKVSAASCGWPYRYWEG